MLGVIKISTNAAGDIRCSLRSQANDTTGAATRDSRSLVSCVNVHHFLDDMLPIYGPRAGFGWLPRDKKFTKYGASTCREAAAVMTARWGLDAVFLTGTLPGSGAQVFKALAAYSSYVVRRVNQWLRNKHKEIVFVWVWEFQKRGALHNHVLVSGAPREVLAKIIEGWRGFWVKLLTQVSEVARVDLFDRGDGTSWSEAPHMVRTDAQWAKKEVGRYLSKYISKKACKVAGELSYNPAAWWGVSRNLLRMVQAERLEVVSRAFNWEGISERFDIIASGVVETADTVFRVFNPIFVVDRGLITFRAPDEARRVFAVVSWAVQNLVRDKAPVFDLEQFFSGRWIAGVA